MQIGFQSIKIIIRMANSVVPDETTRYELSHLDLHCLQRYLFRSVGLKGLILFQCMYIGCDIHIYG